MSTRTRVASLEDVLTDSTAIFRVRAADGIEREAICHRRDGEVFGWLNACQHFTHIPIDKGDGAAMRNGEFVCENHGVYFEADSGRCTFGPCQGAYLETVDLAVTDGTVYLTDDEYTYAGPGPLEGDEADLTSTSNVKF
ncbi:Rieske (2Fe-2S) protein [Saliphagus sp. GCM10025308]